MKSLWIVFFLFFCLSVQAQKSKAFQLGTQLSYLAYRDEAFSPLLYNGLGIGIQLGDRVEMPNWIQGFELALTGNFYFSLLDNPATFANNAGLGTFSKLNFHWYKKSIQREKWQLAIGGKVYGHYNGLFFVNHSNNILSYDIQISLDPAALFNYQLNTKWSLEATTHFPLISYNSRPSSEGLLPFEDYNLDVGELLFGGNLYSISNIFFLENRVSIIRQLKNQHAIRLFYNWIGGVNNSVAPLEYAGHSIGFAYWFNTTKVIQNEK